MMTAMISGRYDDMLAYEEDVNVFLRYPPQVVLR